MDFGDFTAAGLPITYQQTKSELVAANSRRHIIWAKYWSQGFSSESEGLVASAVTVLVIHGFERVKVEHPTEHDAMIPKPSEVQFATFDHKRSPVSKARQPIDPGMPSLSVKYATKRADHQNDEHVR